VWHRRLAGALFGFHDALYVTPRLHDEVACSTREAVMLILTREQCRQVDQYAIGGLRIPGAVLMENAGRGAAEQIERTTEGKVGRKRAAVIAGKGNNGGDGFVIARHLDRLGWDVAVYLAFDPTSLSGDAAVHFAPLERLNISCTRIEISRAIETWEQADVVVDALLGTGFAGKVRDPLGEIIQAINTLAGPRIIAVDIPSGLDADSGEPGDVAIEADLTITFLALKPGLVSPAAKRFVGNIIVSDIGFPLIKVLRAMGIETG
jgi:NAD(P)H-hydrate epimerase